MQRLRARTTPGLAPPDRNRQRRLAITGLLFPPATKTVPLGSSVAVCPSTPSPILSASSQVPVTGSQILTPLPIPLW